MKKKLPIGISTLSEIIEDGYVYIDKTRYVANLVSCGKYYFLSRPRRFGKSLLLDTLKQAFLGNKELFTGLYLEHNWDWKTIYPVIHISFGGGSAYESKKNLLALIKAALQRHASHYRVEYKSDNYGEAFSQLIQALAEKYEQKVVLLIDEYDKPILDVIHKPEEATENREILKGLYSYIKDNDPYLRFVLLTGVSKFSKISLFSGLNNLNDITLDAQYADICGYTQVELEREFAYYLTDGQVDLAKLKLWYNGYNFAGTEEQKVYNPFDILLFCSKNYQYRSYWFETGTPTFLVRLIETKQYFIPDFESLLVSEDILFTFDVANISVSTLLFQTGYLTIKEVTTIGTQYAYVLSYPNLEVKASLNRALAEIGSGLDNRNKNISKIYQALQSNNIASFEQIFSSFFASIPHDWYRNNPMGQYEGFYASIVYSYLAGLGYDLRVEDATNQGKVDLTLITPDKVLIFEFKLTKYGTAAEALEQIKAKGYPQKYTAIGKPIYLLGISFNSDEKNAADFVYVLQ